MSAHASKRMRLSSSKSPLVGDMSVFADSHVVDGASSSDYSKSLTFSRYQLMNYGCALEPPQEQPALVLYVEKSSL